jgi:transcriptional regulator with PAS, ATPase and Fis domain
MRSEEVRREIEDRFRRLVEVMPVAVYVCDTTGIIQNYNHRAVELWGRKPKPGDPAQRHCGSLRLYSADGKLVPHERSKMAEVLRTGIEARDLDVVIERPDGSRITVLVNIVPLRNADGELIGAMNCFQDITDRKRAEESVREASASCGWCWMRSPSASRSSIVPGTASSVIRPPTVSGAGRYAPDPSGTRKVRRGGTPVE